MRVLRWPHPALRYKAKPIAQVDETIFHWVEEMLELMYKHQGVALAATQVGLPIRLFVGNLTSRPIDRTQAFVAINPVVSGLKGSVDSEEGCLSFPEMYARVRRAKEATVTAFALDGTPISKRVTGLEARIWQHETDHLDGVVFTDYFSAITKMSKRGDIRSFEGMFRKSQESGAIGPDGLLQAEIAALDKALVAKGILRDSSDSLTPPEVSFRPQRPHDGQAEGSGDSEQPAEQANDQNRPQSGGE